MNQQVLDVLMQLFAAVAQLDGLTREEETVIRTFLEEELPHDVAEQYFAQFRSYAERSDLRDLEALCAKVNPDLTARQKFYIITRLLELINADNNLSDRELDALRTIVAGFNLATEEYAPLFDFITTDKPRQLLHRNLLIISSGLGSMRGAHLEVEGFVGYIAVLHIESVDVFVLRYIGNGEAYLNGQLLRSGHVYQLTPGSVIRSGLTQPVYYSDIIAEFLEPKQKSRIVFSAQDVCYTFPTGHTGLLNINMAEQSGRLVALMGASGAGKSTLLSVLNGSLKPTSGHVTLNTIDVHLRPEALQGLIGFVSQDDLLMEELTVFENLYYNAKLCFSNLTPPQLRAKVEQTLQELGLLEIKDLKVGSPLDKKISGGQRKRLNIALELIREPAVLFVDEPTSGLSSRDSENVMDLLKELARRGKLVFVVIHQPSSEIFKLFDRLLLLDTGGYQIYYGQPLEALRYFRRAMNYAHSEQAVCGECGNVNPEQIFTIVETRIVDEYGNQTPLRKIGPQRWHQLYQQHRLTTPLLPPPPAGPDERPESNLRLPGFFEQIGVFFRRDLRSKLGNTSYLLLNFLEAPLLALVLAWLLRYEHPGDNNTLGYSLLENVNLSAYLFTSVLVSLFIGLTVSAEEILRDRKIRKREAFLHLSHGSYLSSKLLLLFSLSALQTLLYVVVGSWITGTSDLALAHWFMLFSLTCFANVLGLNISSAFDSAVTIYILIPILLIPQIILSGAMIRFGELNPGVSGAGTVPTAANAMASRWAYEGLAVYQFRNNSFEKHFYQSDRKLRIAAYKANNWIPALQGKLDYCLSHYGVALDADAVRADLRLLHNELTAELGSRYPKALSEMLGKQSFTPETGAQLQKLLDAMAAGYRKQLTAAQEEKDRILKQLMAAGDDPAQLRRDHYNIRLEELVTGKLEANPVVEVEDRLIQLSDPIYHEKRPERLTSRMLQTDAHFFAPYKYLFGLRIHTFWFNAIILWLLTALLYAALYFNLLRRVVGMLEKARTRIVHKKGRIATVAAE